MAHAGVQQQRRPPRTPSGRIGLRGGHEDLDVRAHRGHRAVGLPARTRSLPDGQTKRHEGHRVLPRVRPDHLVVQARRDRVRTQAGSSRCLRPDHRHAQPRGTCRYRGGPDLPGKAVPQADAGRARRSSRQHRPRLSPSRRGVRRFRPSVRRHLVGELGRGRFGCRPGGDPTGRSHRGLRRSSHLGIRQLHLSGSCPCRHHRRSHGGTRRATDHRPDHDRLDPRRFGRSGPRPASPGRPGGGGERNADHLLRRSRGRPRPDRRSGRTHFRAG
ncbi:unannotated protein [freshwater metagenome]|uniref:Unannotated protein n=1 Tax=freshwater metagenome TaxID=449393 RepID=A0A6J6HAR4_9ZZZZ